MQRVVVKRSKWQRDRNRLEFRHDQFYDEFRDYNCIGHIVRGVLDHKPQYSKYAICYISYLNDVRFNDESLREALLVQFYSEMGVELVFED